MVIQRNTADGGTDGAGTLGTLTAANSVNSGMALTPVGTAAVYSDDLGWRGLELKFVTPAGTSYTTSPVSGSPTAMSVTFYDYMPSAVASTSEVNSLRNGTTRVAAVNHTNLNKIQFFGVSTTALFTSTVNIPANSMYRVVYTYDASGNWTFAWYLGDSMTPIETPASGTADFSSVGAPTIIAFGKRSGGWTGTRYMKDVAYDPNSSTPIAPTGSTIGPLGIVAHIGDSTSSQDGNGATNVPLAYTNAGWLAGDVSFYGVGSKTINGSDANGKTTVQNIIDARAAMTAEPRVWVIGLATNSRTATDATTDSDVATVMAQINSIGSPGKVLWVGISQATANGGLDANSIRRNIRLKYQETLYSNLRFLDLDLFIRNGRDETGIWYSPIDANFAHMSVTGYTTIRNPIIANAARAVIATFQGSTAMGGSGTVAETGTPAIPGAASLSGAGALTAAGKPAAAGAVALGGTGTLLGSGANAPTGAVALSGVGALGLSGKPAFAGTLALSGGGALTAAGKPGFTAAEALSGGAVLELAGHPHFTGTLTLGGTGALTAATSSPTREIVLTAAPLPDRWATMPLPNRWSTTPEES